MATSSLESLLKSVNKTTKLAMRAIDELNSESRNKFPSQKEIPREELIKVCQIWRHQLIQALETQGSKDLPIENDKEDEFVDASEGPSTQTQNSQNDEGTQTSGGGTSNAGSSAPKLINQNEATRVCSYHKWRECKHKDTCKFLHPKLCQKYLWYGPSKTDPEHGCDKANCKLYHPPLCYGSMKYHECRIKRCKKRHLPETKFTVKESKGPKNDKGKNSRRRVPKPKAKPKFSREPNSTPKEPNPPLNQPVHQPSQDPVTVVNPPPTGAPFLGGMAMGPWEQRLQHLEKLILSRPVMGNPVPPQEVQYCT